MASQQNLRNSTSTSTSSQGASSTNLLGPNIRETIILDGEEYLLQSADDASDKGDDSSEESDEEVGEATVKKQTSSSSVVEEEKRTEGDATVTTRTMTTSTTVIKPLIEMKNELEEIGANSEMAEKIAVQEQLIQDQQHEIDRFREDIDKMKKSNSISLKQIYSKDEDIRSYKQEIEALKKTNASQCEERLTFLKSINKMDSQLKEKAEYILILEEELRKLRAQLNEMRENTSREAPTQEEKKEEKKEEEKKVEEKREERDDSEEIRLLKEQIGQLQIDLEKTTTSTHQLVFKILIAAGFFCFLVILFAGLTCD